MTPVKELSERAVVRVVQSIPLAAPSTAKIGFIIKFLLVKVNICGGGGVTRGRKLPNECLANIDVLVPPKINEQNLRWN